MSMPSGTSPEDTTRSTTENRQFSYLKHWDTPTEQDRAFKENLSSARIQMNKDENKVAKYTSAVWTGSKSSPQPQTSKGFVSARERERERERQRQRQRERENCVEKRYERDVDDAAVWARHSFSLVSRATVLTCFHRVPSAFSCLLGFYAQRNGTVSLGKTPLAYWLDVQTDR